MYLEKLEERAAKLEHDMRELCGDDGEISAENRSKFDRMEGELHGVEKSIAQAKDEELDELRGKLAAQDGENAGKGTDEARSAFYEFMHLGYDKVDAEMRASLIAGNDTNGGYVVPENLHAELVEKARAINPIMRLATTFNLTGSASMELPIKATNGKVANAAETDARAEQAAPTFGNTTLTAYDYYTDQRATQLFLDEVAGSEAMLMNWMYEDIYEQAEADAANGDGASKCKGLFTETYDAVQHVATAGTVTASDVMDQYFALKAGYRANATWLANSATASALSKLTHPAASGSIPFVTMGADGRLMMMGRPIEQCDSAPSIGTGTLPIAFGDIAKAYAVAIHKNVNILRDPYTATPKIRFYGLARIGGKQWNPEAAVLLSTAIG